jgi:hypothetical protein
VLNAPEPLTPTESSSPPPAVGHTESSDGGFDPRARPQTSLQREARARVASGPEPFFKTPEHLMFDRCRSPLPKSPSESIDRPTLVL